MNSIDDLRDQLCRKLKKIYDDKSFVISILTYVDTEKNMKAMLHFIDTDDSIDSDKITLYALELNSQK